MNWLQQLVVRKYLLKAFASGATMLFQEIWNAARTVYHQGHASTTRAMLITELENVVSWEHRVYRHNKTGNLYLVIERVLNCTNAVEGSELIVYRGIRDNKLMATIYARESCEFYEKFTGINYKA